MGRSFGLRRELKKKKSFRPRAFRDVNTMRSKLFWRWKKVPSERFVNLVKSLVYLEELKCDGFVKDLTSLWTSKAHAYQLCFLWSSSNLLLKRQLRSRYFVPKSLEIVGVCTRRQIWRIHKGFGSFVDVKSPRISALFRLVIFEFTAQKAVTSERFVPHFPYGQQWLKTWHSVHFNFCNFIPITILRAYLSIQFKCRAINNFLRVAFKTSKKFRVMQFSALYLLRYHTCSIINPCLNTDLSTLFQSPYFVHTFHHILNAEPSTISFTSSKMFQDLQVQFSFLTCLV